MKKFRLSSEIFSPIHSDISLDDSSVFSLGSVSNTPEFRKEIESSKSETYERSSSIESICKTNLKASAAAFDVIVNDIKKQSNINAEKEERFKESYKILKRSMDELYNKVSDPLFSPVSSDISFEYNNWAEKMPVQGKPDSVLEKPKNLKKDSKRNESTKHKNVSQISNKTFDTKESKLRKKDNNQKSRNVCLPTEAIENDQDCKIKSEVCVNEINSIHTLQNSKSSGTVSSSTQTCEYFEATSRKENLKDFYAQKQRKPAASNSVSATENKNLSIETSIQIAISMEMDNLRRLMLEQNSSLYRELQKLEETAKKQSATTGYLFSVIEKLLEENKKLISNKIKI